MLFAVNEIDDVAEIYLGLTHTPTYVENGVKFISAKNTSCDYLDLSDVKYISREEFEALFDENSSVPEIVTTFQALLELLKHQFIIVEQEELFSTITIKKNPNRSEDEEIGEIDEYN